MQPDERPLPESLTRLLSADPPASRSRPVPMAQAPPPTDGVSRHAALEGALLRGFVYGVSGLVWLAVMLLIARHVAF